MTSPEIDAVLLVGPSAPATKQIAARLGGHDGIGGGAGVFRAGHVQFVRQRFHPVIGHRNGRGIERVRLDDVRARLEILPVDGLDQMRLGQVEQDRCCP